MPRDFDRDLVFTIAYALAYSKKWPDRMKAPSITEVDGLAGDVLKHLRRSNYRIEQGPPAADAGSWPPKQNEQP